MAWQTPISYMASFIGRIKQGVAAVTYQPYDEVNKKRGVQWAASRRIEGAAEGVAYYSVIEVGSKPIDLKRREFAFSGTEVIADIFQDPTYTGGTIDPVYNANGYTLQPPSFELVLKAGVTVTDEGTMFAPTIYAIGSESNQSKGIANALYGSNYILKPNTNYLLRFYSNDPLQQNIAVRIEGYEGELDFYP